MKILGKELKFNDKNVYHEGNKPLASDIKFIDGKTFQDKLNDGSLKGPKGDTGAKGATGATGSTGATGPQGPQGAKGNTGTSIRFKGAWSSTTAYVCDANYVDIVTSGGNSYRCKTSNTNQAVTNTTYWELIAQKGNTGNTGAQGPQGIQGPKGDKGDTGSTGAQGPKGDKGATGSQGPQGIQGAKGATGVSMRLLGAWSSSTSYVNNSSYIDVVTSGGSTYACKVSNTNQAVTNTSYWTLIASKGDKGNTGDKGATGSQGPQGIQGIQGVKGDKGDKGATGSQGPKGATGVSMRLLGAWSSSTSYVNNSTYIDLVTANGNTYACKTSHTNQAVTNTTYWTLIAQKGATGNTGATGPQGPQGAKGATGATGPQGPKGDTGATGAQGPQGVTPTIKAGTVTTGAAGSNASVTASTSGTTTTFNFTIPRGATGATGAQGPQGPKGDKGATGATGATGAAGVTPTIKAGTVTTGNAGTSASVSASTSGTTTTFNFTIPRGATGATGPQGPKGDTGAKGATGPQGPQGAKGDTGAKGATGATGATGPAGRDGLTTSIKVNGTTHTHSSGLITLPNYAPASGGTMTGRLTLNYTGGPRVVMNDGTNEMWIGMNSDASKFGLYDNKAGVYMVSKTPGGETILSGNADTATKFKTARTINGTSFNGSANITTANWGTARTITLGATGKSVNGSADVSWSFAEIVKGQGNTYDTASSTIYFNNAGTKHKARISVYNNDTEDYAQFALRTADATVNGLQLYPNNATLGSGLTMDGGIVTKFGGVTLNNNKTSTYYSVDAHRKCDSGTATYSTARFGCVNSYGGCAAIETRHDGETVGYVRALPNGGIQIGSGKKLHIQASAPTENLATGDIWIDI